jgi:nitroreductase
MRFSHFVGGRNWLHLGRIAGILARMSETIDPITHRQADHPIEPYFLRRWSPRAMSGEPITMEQVNTLFEAARWAPSTYNEQEWRFLYARRDTPEWPLIHGLLGEFNQIWCAKAALLCVVVAHKVFERNAKPNPVHLFDAGSAFMSLALQGTAMGLVVHGMAGFDYERAAKELNVPDEYAVIAMFTVGHHGKIEDLPEPMREGEVPSGRKKVSEISCEGRFAF